MDNKITGKRVAIHFEYDWLKYVLVILASIFLCYFLFTQINATRESEKLDIFFATYKSYLDENTFEKEIKDAVNKDSKYKIRDVNIAFQDPLDDNYSVQANANAFTADIMILSESDMKEIGHWFVELSPEFLNNFLPTGMEVEFFTFNPGPDADVDPAIKDRIGKNFGIRVDNLLNINNSVLDEPPFIFDCVANYEKEGWGDQITDQMREYDNKFYMVFAVGGTKIGKYGKDEDYHHLNQSFIFARYFLERFNTAKVSGD